MENRNLRQHFSLCDNILCDSNISSKCPWKGHRSDLWC